jgi:hydroxyethylthiazole kinase-like uncharacterized protein yjeF
MTMGGEHVEVTPGLLKGWPIPSPGDGGTKESRGQVLVVGGAAQTPGAVLLAAVASLRAGGGKLTIGTVASTAAPLAVAVPEALVEGLPETEGGSIAVDAADGVAGMAESARAVLFGPGMTDEDACCDLLGAVLPRMSGAVVVLDALALAHLERDPDALRPFEGRAVLTPNRQELSLMLGVASGSIEDDPEGAVRDAASRYGAVVSLGGGESRVAAPDGTVWRETTGGIGLGVSGSGDCAAGVLVGLLARGADVAQAAVWAAFLHGSAGDRLAARVGRLGYLAREIADEIPLVLGQFDT